MRLITRSDFDGLACAALLEELGIVDDYLYCHPKDLQDGKIKVTSNDVIANMPFVEGCGLWFDNLAVPKGAPHLDAALAFMNHVLKPEESVLITAEFPYSNPNKAALEYLKTSDPEAYATYMGYSATNPSAEFLSNAHPLMDVGDATTLYDQLWTDFKGE